MNEHCGTLSRREVLCRIGGGFGALALTSVFADAGFLSAASSAAVGGNPLAPKPPHFAPRARRLIFLFMNGGPSHVDTFDPKPALQKFAGQQPPGELYKKNKGSGFMPSPLGFEKYGQSGIEVSETLPHLARLIDDCCVIRSMKTD